jgi:hypothetical protein
MSKLKVEVQITEADIARIKPRMMARISIPGDGKPWFVRPIEHIQPLPKELNGINLYIAEITIDNANSSLRLDQNTEVEIITDSFNDVLHLRNDAIHFDGNRAYVAISSGREKYDLREIQTRSANTVTVPPMKPNPLPIVSNAKLPMPQPPA